MAEMNRAQQAIFDCIPKDLQRRYGKKAREAPTSYPAAVMMKCLDCSGHHYDEVKACRIEGCSLHAHRERLFNRVSKKEQRLRGKGDDLAETA